jgi:hypothetical protein
MPRIVYSDSFLTTVQPPEDWDRRPLPNLLYRARDPVTRDQELDRLERWYQDLASEEKPNVLQRLRSMKFREFWSAYYELMTSEIARRVGAVSLHLAPELFGKHPDFEITFPSGSQIWEVATAYQTAVRETNDDLAHDLANQLNRHFQHRWRVIVEAENFWNGRVHLTPALPRIHAWLDRLESGGTERIRLTPPLISCDLHLRAHRPPDGAEIRPIVSDLMGQGGNVTATDQLRNVLRKKIKKYAHIRSGLAPLVIFLYEGDLLHISRESLESALFGSLQVTFRPGQDEAPLSLAHGGLFMPDSNGHPRNTRVSAVVYGRRQWHNGIPHACLFIYHHPAALNPIPDDQFARLPQCRLTIRETEVAQNWSTDISGDIQILPLDAA